MKTRAAFSSVVLAIGAFAVTLSAQQRVPADPNEAAIKFQVKNFESTLRLAVLRSGQEVAEKARRIVRDIDLQYVAEVGISGWWTPDVGYTFDVVVPDMMPTSVSLFVMLQNQLARTAAPPVRNVAAGAVAGAGTTTPDSMKVSPVDPFNPTAEYSDTTRQALIDALVDNSGGLVFKAGQTVQIVAGPTPAVMPNLTQPDSRKLILTVKGEDLLAFRKGELTREDLIARIQERRF